MRKILSVLLAVVMLAAMFVMPTSAAEAELGLVITEIGYDSGFDPIDGVVFRDRDDVYEFVEIYNGSDAAINLYDYSLAYTDRAAAGADPAATKFTKFTPILDPAVSAELGNTDGSVNTSETNRSARSRYFPANPKVAILEPGETAVIWLYTTEAYGYAYASTRDSDGVHYQDGNNKYGGGYGVYDYANGGIPFDAFKAYYGIPAETLVVAVDANAKVQTTTVADLFMTSAFAGTTGYYNTWWDKELNTDGHRVQQTTNPNGATTASTDMMAQIYAAANGRFQLTNEGTATVALVKSETFKDKDALKNLNVADAESYVTYTAGKNSVADKSYSYTYSVEADAVKAGQEYALNIANPGYLFDAQIAAFTTFGCINRSYNCGNPFNVFDWLVGDTITLNDPNETNAADIKALISTEKFDRIIGDTVTKHNYIIPVDVEALINIAEADTWRSSYTDRVTWDAATGTLAVKNGTYVAIRNKAKTDYAPVNIVELISSEALVNAYNEAVYSDFVLSYDIKYNGDVENKASAASHAGLIYAYDGNVSYSAFLLTQGGYGINRICYMGLCDKYDIDSDIYAGTLDSKGVSIINRITHGKILAAEPAKATTGNDEALRMYNYGKAVNITVLFDWDRGATVYVDGAKVSEPTSAHENELKFLRGDFGLGVMAAPYVDAEISNIEMAYVSEPVLAEYELFLSNATDAEFRGEPETGDATVYVVVAMAIAFVSLAAVVIIKRKKATN